MLIDPARVALIAIVGRSHHPVRSWPQVSEAYRRTIARLGLGASHAPRCEIIDGEGQVVAHVSYNGRVWPGDVRDWSPDIRPIYDPLPLR